LQTPAFAPHAITVGASGPDDSAAVFSDYGKCVDIYAPGVNITSACGSAICGWTDDEDDDDASDRNHGNSKDEGAEQSLVEFKTSSQDDADPPKATDMSQSATADSTNSITKEDSSGKKSKDKTANKKKHRVLNKYTALSGTSMATPHVTGVIAQLLQAFPDSTPDDVARMLTCQAVPGILDIKQDRSPAVTRNLLLQAPKKIERRKRKRQRQKQQEPVDGTGNGNSTNGSGNSTSDSDSDIASGKGSNRSYYNATIVGKVPVEVEDRIVSVNFTEYDYICEMGSGCEKFNKCSGKGYCQQVLITSVGSLNACYFKIFYLCFYILP
jgi:subtilisin family serine protease